MSGACVSVQLACIGLVTIEAVEDEILGVRLHGGPRPRAFLLGSALPDTAAVRDLVERLRAYDRGDDPQFQAVALPQESRAFAGLVRDALRATDLGETLSYGALAARAGHPNAARAVGSVLAKNRWPLVVPCHRVVRASGASGAFTGGDGAATKQALLAHERKDSVRAP